MPPKSRRLRITGCFAATAALITGMALSTGAPSTSGAASPITAANPFRTGRTLIIPHGGGDGLYPENTMLAYDRTMAAGADVVDVDVRSTADGVLVAFHDATLARTTNGTGKVEDKTYAQLAALDAGWTFTLAGKQPFRGKGVRIPTLQAVLRRFPRALVSLDLKDESMSMIAPTCALLRLLRRTSDVFVGSNSDAQILAFRTACPDVRTSATMVDVYASRDARAANDRSFVPRAFVDQPPFRSDSGTELVSKDSLAYAHSKGIAILTWVVDNPADMRRLVSWGVDGIYTRRPDVLLSVLTSMGKR